jgi:predicted transposase YdaD
MIWRLRWGERWLYVYLLLEFQSSVDRFMAVRLLTYIGLLYQNLVAAGKIPPGSPLPPVLPIVRYNGEQRWWAKTSLDELKEPGLPARLSYWQPQIRYVLLDEHRYQDAELASQRNLAAALFRLENSRSPEDLQRVLVTLLDWLRAPGQTGLRRAFVVWIKRVLLPARLPDTEIPDIIELQEMQAMLAERVKTWTEQWKQQGLQEGIREGMQQGMQQGMEQGVHKGVHIGEAKLLRRLLLHRFGPLPTWVEQRLQDADESTLESWAERVLDCGTLEDVFGGSS